jgi:hypothetical protein
MKEQKHSKTKILGLDPGKNTGWALFHETKMISSGTIDGGVYGFINWWLGFRQNEGKKLDTIVCESFNPEVGLGGKNQTWSLEVQGALKLLCLQESIDLKFQQRSDKANMFGQNFVGTKGEAERREWLKARGLIFETTHAMEAATHVLVDRRLSRDINFWKTYWA